MSRKLWLLIPVLLAPLHAQDKPDQGKILQEVLRRLDTLERENRELLEQVKELKQLSQPQQATKAETETGQPAEPAPLADRVKINEERIAEQAQTKVESAQKLPVWLSGTLLFNAFLNKNDGVTRAQPVRSSERSWLLRRYAASDSVRIGLPRPGASRRRPC